MSIFEYGEAVNVSFDGDVFYGPFILAGFTPEGKAIVAFPLSENEQAFRGGHTYKVQIYDFARKIIAGKGHKGHKKEKE